MNLRCLPMVPAVGTYFRFDGVLYRIDGLSQQTGGPEYSLVFPATNVPDNGALEDALPGVMALTAAERYRTEIIIEIPQD